MRVARRPKVCVITGYGINADEELAQAFRMAGADAMRVHVSDLIEHPARLAEFRILAFPGGFSFGDHLGSGMVFAHRFRMRLKPAMEEFVARGGLAIGICNGFQVLVKMGVLPNLSGSWDQEVSLIHNDSGKYEDRWVRLAFDPASPCLWTRGLDSMEVPVRHGEGKFVARSEEQLEALSTRGLVAARYTARTRRADGQVPYPDDPNGSTDHIAGICDATGRIFGLMPHPEAYIFAENHPEWSRDSAKLPPNGLAIFLNGVKAAAIPL